MRKKLLGLLSVVAIAGGVFAFNSKTSECPLEETSECPLKDTPDCPLLSETSNLPECCKKK